MKKILSLVLALVMVMSLATTAFADTLTATSTTATKDVKASYVKGEVTNVESVDVSWGSMEFTYTSAATIWDPATHTYITNGSAEAEWTFAEGANVITVANHSDVAVNVTLAYAKTVENVNGTLSKTTMALKAATENSAQDAAPKDTSSLTLTGDLPADHEAKGVVGTITVTLGTPASN